MIHEITHTWTYADSHKIWGNYPHARCKFYQALWEPGYMANTLQNIALLQGARLPTVLNSEPWDSWRCGVMATAYIYNHFAKTNCFALLVNKIGYMVSITCIRLPLSHNNPYTSSCNLHAWDIRRVIMAVFPWLYKYTSILTFMAFSTILHSAVFRIASVTIKNIIIFC